MKKQQLLWAGLFLSVAVGFAQSGPDKVCEVNVTSPKPGGAKQFEEARKTHNKFHVAEKDPVPIMIWDITTGPNTGKYLTVSCGMLWKDMDGKEAFDKRDQADREKTLALASAGGQASYYIFRPDLSRAPEKSDPAQRMTIVHYFLKPSGVPQFIDSVKRINAAIEKTKYASKPSRWYQLANGGEGPHFVSVTDRNTWADMQGPEQSMIDMLKQAYGDDDKTLQNLRDSFDHTISEMGEYRADLSYIPAK